MTKLRTLVLTTISTLALLMMVGIATDAEARHRGYPECREANMSCVKETSAVHRVCRTECHQEVMDAIATAKEKCETDELDEEACKALVHESAAAVAAECRDECKTEFKATRSECRVAAKECRDTSSDTVDPVCVDSCKDDFTQCVDDLRSCKRACHTVGKEAAAACRDAGLPFREMLLCLHDARKEAQMCSRECHAANSCHMDMRECLSECPVVAEP